MKIGIVCYPSLGGSGIVATELGHELAARGHEVHFITYEVPFRLNIENENIHFHEVELNRYDLFKYPDYALTLSVKIASVAKKFHLDILHVHYAIPHATSAYLAKQILENEKPAVITTLHGTDITLVGKDPAYNEIVKFSIERSDGVTAVSHHLKQETLEHFHISKPVEVIHNFFIPRKELIGTQPIRSSYVKEGEKLLIHSSNFRSVKRVGDVMQIFMKVRKKIPSKLFLLGSGPGIEAVFETVKENQLEEDVFFLGKNREIDPYVASSDLLLLPSEHESFGLVALEAMAYGVPVIATDVGGIPEVVEDGRTGFLSKLGDVDRMAKTSVKLLSDDKFYAKMSREGMLVAHEKFSVQKILPKYVSFYESFL